MDHMLFSSRVVGWANLRHAPKSFLRPDDVRRNKAAGRHLLFRIWTKKHYTVCWNDMPAIV